MENLISADRILSAYAQKVGSRYFEPAIRFHDGDGWYNYTIYDLTDFWAGVAIRRLMQGDARLTIVDDYGHMLT